MIFEGIILIVFLPVLIGLIVGGTVFYASNAATPPYSFRPKKMEDFQNLITEIREERLPDIEKDPLAIEINRVYMRHVSGLITSFDNDIQARIDLIEMVLGLPISYPTDDRDQRYISSLLIDSCELRKDIKKNGPMF